MEKYGFDIFNPDGTINKSRLALAMLMDGADPNDDFNLAALIAQLSNKNVTVNAYDSVQSAVIDNNKSAGLVAVGAGLGGSPSTKVGGTLLGVSEQQEKTQLTNLQHHIESVKPVTSSEEAKKQNTAALALGLGGLGALGVTGGGIAANKKEKEEEEEEKKDSEFELLESGEGIQKEEEDDKKDWLYGLGIGLSAASIVGKELSKDDDDDDNPEQEFQL